MNSAGAGDNPDRDLAEQSCVGGMMHSNAAADYALTRLRIDDFARLECRVLFEAIQRLRQRGVSLPDVLAVQAELGRRRISLGGDHNEYVPALFWRIGSVCLHHYWTGKVRENSRRRLGAAA